MSNILVRQAHRRGPKLITREAHNDALRRQHFEDLLRRIELQDANARAELERPVPNEDQTWWEYGDSIGFATRTEDELYRFDQRHVGKWRNELGSRLAAARSQDSTTRGRLACAGQVLQGLEYCLKEGMVNIELGLMTVDEATKLRDESLLAHFAELTSRATEPECFWALYWLRNEFLRPHVNPPHPMYRHEIRPECQLPWPGIPGWRLLVRLFMKRPTDFDLHDDPALTAKRRRRILTDTVFVARILLAYVKPERTPRVPSPPIELRPNAERFKP